MFNSLSLLFPGRVVTVWSRDPNAPAVLGDKADPLCVCGNLYVHIPIINHHARGSVYLSTLNLTHSRWYFRYFLSSPTERRTIGGFFGSHVWRMPWRILSFSPCRLTRVLGMGGVLRRNFGPNWNPPKAESNLTADYRPKLQQSVGALNS